MASDTSLVFNIIAKDKASKVFEKVRANADNTGKAIALALAPAAGPLAAGATAGIMSVGAAMAGASAAAGVYKSVFTSAFSEVQKASGKTQDLRDKITLIEKQIKVANATGFGDAGALEKKRASAINELLSRYALLPPETRKVTVAYDAMRDSWKKFVDSNKPAVYAQMTSGFSLMEKIIPKLQPLFDVASAAVTRLLERMTRFTDGGGIDRLVAFLTGQAGPAFENLERIGANLAVTIGKMFGAFNANGPTMLGFLADASDKMRAWADGGGAQRLAEYFQQQGPATGQILLDIGRAVVTIGQAMAPFAPISIAIAGALAQIVAAVPPGVLTAIVGAFLAYNIALKANAAASALSATGLLGFVSKANMAKVAAAASAVAQGVWNAAMVAANFAAMNIRLAAYAVTQGAVTVATNAWAAAQWLLNAAMSMNPIGLVVIAIVALIAIIVLLWNKCDWFRNFWIAVWDHVKLVASTAWNWIKEKVLQFWNWIMPIIKTHASNIVAAWDLIKLGAKVAWEWISTKVSNVFNTLKTGATTIGNKLSSMWDGLKSGFRAAINLIVRGWNSLHFSIPGFSFAGINVQGFSIGTPKLPYLAKGGNIAGSGMAVVGERGPELVHLSKGASVTPLNRSGGRQRLVMDLHGEREIVALFRRLIRTADLLQEA